MDQVGLTKIIKPPVDFGKIRIYFTKEFGRDSSVMVINLDNLSFEICPRYPDQAELNQRWKALPGTYQMAWRLPDNQTGQMTTSYYMLSMNKKVLTMSGVFGPILPIDDNHIRILSGPFAGEIMEYESGSGNLLHQDMVFCPLQQRNFGSQE
jgi:hypothetical protein